MSAELTTPINLAKTESPEWELELELESNKVTGSLDYVDAFDGWLTRAPAFSSAHPDIPSLVLKKIKGKRIEGYMIQVRLTYESNDTAATYPGREPGAIKRYTIEPTGGEESITTFHKLKDLVVNSQEALTELLASPRAPTDYEAAITKIGADPLALFAVEKIRKNIDAYRHSGMIWVERFTSKDLTGDMQPENFNTIQTPPGEPPTLSAAANWLYIPGSASPNADGETWEMERKWEASLPTGWDEWFYLPEAP